jgi:hypothetical protein
MMEATIGDGDRNNDANVGKKCALVVSSISLPLRPKGRNGLVLAPWSGAPNQSMVGGPPSHSAIKRGWGPRLAVRGSPRRRTPHPTNPNPTRGRTGAAGSSTTAAAEAFLLDSTYTVPPPDARLHRPWHRRPRADTASPVSSRGRPCDHDLRDGVRLCTSVQPRWFEPLISPSVILLVVLGVVDLDLRAPFVYL